MHAKDETCKGSHFSINSDAIARKSGMRLNQHCFVEVNCWPFIGHSLSEDKLSENNEFSLHLWGTMDWGVSLHADLAIFLIWGTFPPKFSSHAFRLILTNWNLGVIVSVFHIDRKMYEWKIAITDAEQNHSFL